MIILQKEKQTNNNKIYKQKHYNMKKNLLFLITLLVMSIPAWGEIITIVPNNATTGSTGSSYVEKELAFTVDAIEYSINNWNPKSLQIRGNKAEMVNFYFLNNTSLSGKITKITLTTTGEFLIPSKIFLVTSNTPIPSATITGGTAGVGTDKTKSVSWDVTGDDLTYFKIYLANGGTSGTAILKDIVIEYTPPITSSPTIIATPYSLDVFNATDMNSVSQKITVGGANLTTDISLGITGTDAQYFSVTPSTLSQSTGNVADTEVTVTYAPTVAGSHTATLTLSSEGATSVTYDLKGTATMPILATAVVTDATQITKNSFTANWNAVANATSYELSVFKVSGTPEVVCLNEEFNDCAGTGGNTGGWSGSIASADITGLTDWTFNSCKAADKCIKAGASSAQGSITTPALAGLNGSATLTFRAGAWGGDATELLVSISGGGTLSVSSVILLDSEFSTYTVEISNGTANSKIEFKGKQPSKARFFLDDVKVASGGSVSTPIEGSPFTVTTNAMDVTGLEEGTTYAYSVVAKATGYIDSESSKIIMVNTTSVPVDTNLGNILDNGIDNVFYKMNLSLHGIYANGEYLYVKTDNAVCAHPSEDPNPGRDYWADDANDFDQSDWVALKIANPENYVGKTFDAGLIGKYMGSESTPTLEVAEVNVAVNPISVTPNKNKYVVRNILGRCVNNPEDHDVFVVQAKINEFAELAASITKEGDNYFLSSQDGKVAIDNGLGLVEDKHITTGSTFMKFDGVIKTRNKTTTGGTSFKALPDTKEYVILVTNLPEISTSVEGIGSDTDNVTTVVGGNGMISITTTSGVAVNVFDIAGKIVRNVAVADSQMTIEIPAGMYIVKVGNNSSKVIVK